MIIPQVYRDGGVPSYSDCQFDRLGLIFSVYNYKIAVHPLPGERFELNIVIKMSITVHLGLLGADIFYRE